MPKLGLGAGHNRRPYSYQDLDIGSGQNRRLYSYMDTPGMGDPGMAGMPGRALHWDSLRPLPFPHPPQFANRRPGLAMKAKLAWLLAFVRTTGKGVEHKLSSLIQNPGKGEGLVSFSSLAPELEEGGPSFLPERLGVAEDMPVISSQFLNRRNRRHPR